jgi:hypothetical protein
MPDGNRGIISRIDDAFPGAMHLAKQGAPYAAGAVGGVGGGLFLSDVLGHGRPWQDAAWHALVWPHDDPSRRQASSAHVTGAVASGSYHAAAATPSSLARLPLSAR